MVRTRYATTLLLLLLAGVLAPSAVAQGPAPGSCTLGRAEADLDINNIFARVFNTGSLFFGNTTTAGDGYLAPKASEHSPIFASGIWVGGKVNGDLRVAGSRYSGFTFWPGPLGSDGRPVNPNNCSSYDRIYSVSKIEINNYEAGIETAQDLAEWPVELGAPVVDGDGVEGNYNLDGGDRPDIIGDQGIFWVMNDVGGEHSSQGTDPLGIEVQVLAFSFSRADALGNTTFYRYRIINKSGIPIEDTYVSLFSDPDLGNAGDDYVGYDEELGLGFTYNASDTDAVYGVPPAVGYDFFQGPIVDGDTLAATAFSYFENAASGPTTDPSAGEAMYNFMQGLWGDGTPMRAAGNGYGAQGGAPITTFAFPGDPVTEEFWSEVNNDGSGTDNGTGDRRFLITTGPFTLQQNDPQDIVFGIVFAQGASRFNSITALRAADRLAQTAYDNDFQLAPPPPAPPLCQSGSTTLAPGSGNCLEAVSLDGSAALVWGYPTNNANYLGRFEEVDVLLDPTAVHDNTYNFEGFNIYRYPTSGFSQSQRELVATYDIANGVTTVVDQVFSTDLGDLAPTVVARGTDSGIQYSYRIPNVTNYTDYYYGVSAYSYNEESTPKVIESSPTQITVRPAAPTGGASTQAAYGQALDVEGVTVIGTGTVAATVVDPTEVTGDTYRVEFFANPDGTTNYRIVNATTGEVKLDGAAFFAETGESLPIQENVAVIDGISFSLVGPQPGPLLFNPDGNPESLTNMAFVEVVGPGGAEVCVASQPLGCAQVGGDLVYQSYNSTGEYVMYHGGSVGPEGTIGAYTPNDFEIRFTEEGSYAIFPFSTGRSAKVPFEVWDIGVVPPGTENDPSDDVQMIAAINTTAGDDAASECEFEYGDGDPIFGLGTVTDWIYGYYSATTYEDFEAQAEAMAGADGCSPGFNEPAYNLVDFGRGRPIQRILFEDAGIGSVDNMQGVVIRFYTVDPSQPGSVFAVNTSEASFLEGTEEDAVAALENIQVVPNPYFGASNYETGNLSRVVRFTNLPEQAATVRIYTVAGTLIQTLRKEGPSPSLDWNLETQNNLPVASGMYLIHIDIDGVGERVLKFGVVQRRTQITVF